MGTAQGALVGIDIGNATCSATNGERSVFFPSFYATSRRGYQGIGGIASDRHHIGYQGVNYVIGAGALELPAHDSLMNEALPENEAYKRYISDQSVAAFLSAISALYPDAETLDNVTIGTGAPLSIYEAHGKTIADRLVGRHEYTYMGRPRVTTISDVTVYGECLQALRLLPADQIVGKVGTHDIGGGTYGAALHFNGEKVRGKSYRAGIDRLMSDMPTVPGDPGARWDIQREMRRDAKAATAIRQEIGKSILDTLKIIEVKIPFDQCDRHIVIGGGASYAAPIIKAKYRKPVIVLGGSAPEMVNAQSYLKALEAR